MKKTRMSIDDIHAMVGSIRKNVLNMRVTNIYDLQSASGDKSKTYIFKLHQPPYPKVFLLLESGIRFHTSKYARDASSSSATLPSQFTMKLRKHLRGKRLVALQQLEGDRVVDLTFGSDQLQCHLILELYASGNIILTDESYNILSLLRTHKFDENVKMAVKQVYPIEVLEKKSPSDSIQTVPQLTEFVTKWFADLEVKAATMGGGASKTKKKVQTLKQLLLMKESSFGGLGPVIVEHCVVSADLQPGLKIKNAAEFEAIGEDRLTKLVKELQGGWKLLEKLQAEQNTAVVDTTEDGTPLDVPEDTAPKEKCGFIIMKEQVNESLPEQYEEFTPYLYAQHRNKKIQSFDTFDEAVDEYFSRFETETAEVAKQAAQLAAEAKLAKLKKNQKTQIDQLLEVQDKSLKHARLIEENQQDVENVLLVIRSALASGMDWRGLEELVRFEQKNGNPVASLIHELDLAHNRVSILLCDSDNDNDNDDDEEDEDEDEKDQQDKQAHVIWIDLSLSALANAREIYTKKKKAGEKVQKATEATQRAIFAAEKSTTKTLQKQQMKRNTIYERRKIMWFEKFHWFLTNEKYLVIAGKDAHQNELLVKRYLRKGDVYVHADLHGAATCVVRNRAAVAGEKTIPPIPVGTLEQAGCMSVCRSNAWTSQVIAGAYWVHADQVSKTAPAGEYLTTGSFMIRGKKNYIQPSRLEMGLAIVFRVDESSLANHEGDDGDEKAPPAREYDADADVDEDVTQQEETADKPEETQDTVTQDDDDEDKVDDVEEASTDAVEESVPPQATEEDNEAEEARDEDEEATNDSAAPAERPGKKRLSAKERRDLKKGKLPGTLAPVPADASGNKASALKEKTAAASSKANDAAKNVRGKKGKLKKLKKKYADQDDEDRRLRMELLGHTLPDEDAGDEEEGSGDTNDDDDDNDSSKNGNDGEKKPKGADEDEIRRLREKKEKFLKEQEEEAEGADFFDTFTGSPFPNDLVLYAMPMCAPYASLQKYKYKVKLLPGAQKKGKAAKQAMEYFFSSNMKFEKDAAKQHAAHKAQAENGADETTPDVDPLVVQRELMRCIPENELVNCMVGPVKISAPGIYGSSASGKKGGGGGTKKKLSKGKK
uniref:Ribosome quality control complex subunit 2 n=1 Tax=Globisporangium ultimum (strain ATCC 200006 / CBS 805.95 / DAOM BR144) TaxID=431595 RepID=K3WCD0_GLOUD